MGAAKVTLGVDGDANMDPILKKFKDVPISDEILALTGILKGTHPDELNDKDIKYEYLRDKYGL
jgi:hypothetical protein